MNAKLINICDRIKSADKSARPAIVKELIETCDALGEEFTMEHVEQLGEMLGLVPILDSLRTEKNPERIRSLMASAMKLRNTSWKVAAK